MKDMNIDIQEAQRISSRNTLRKITINYQNPKRILKAARSHPFKENIRENLHDL